MGYEEIEPIETLFSSSSPITPTLARPDAGEGVLDRKPLKYFPSPRFGGRLGGGVAFSKALNVTSTNLNRTPVGVTRR